MLNLLLFTKEDESNEFDEESFETDSSDLEQVTQSAFTCSKLTIETLEQGVIYV